MKKHLLLLALLLSHFISKSQDWDYYEPLKSKGNIPEIFTEAFSSKYEKEKNSISREDRRKTRKRKADFHRQSEFFIDEYLTSGKVMFGDTITNYCRMVLDKVIGDNQELKNSIQLFTTKNPYVNATATANGVIFVNIGLIAQLETEAQLAYILSHELVHFTNDHVIEQYVEQEKIYNGEDLYRRKNTDEKLSALSNYSKNHEFEADEIGYSKFYSKTNYSKNAPFQVLDILQYAYLPFDEISFNKSFFESDRYSFPDSYTLDEVQEIKAVDDYDDENSTHPNLLKRRKNLDQIITGNDGLDYIISKESFTHCQKLARYEMSQLFASNMEYGPAIYNSFLLLKEDSINRYARFAIVKALHGLSVYQNDDDFFDVFPDYEDIEGESQQLYFLLNELDENELAILTLRYSYLLKRDFPEDKFVTKLYLRSMRNLVFENDLVDDDFFSEHFQYQKDTIGNKIDSTQNRRRSGKVAKIKRKLNHDEDEPYWKYAFVEFIGDTLFWGDFEHYTELYDEDSQRFTSGKSKREGKYDENLALGIDKVICLTPNYLKMDQRSDDVILFHKTEEKLNKYNQYLSDLSKSLDLEMDLLNYKNLDKNDVETFNNIASLKAWIHERMNHVNHEVINSNFDYVDTLSKKYDSPFIIYTGQLVLREKENYAANIFYSIVVPYAAPFLIADMIRPDYESFNYFFVFDLRNGNALMADYNSYNTSDATDYIKSNLYNSLLQVSSQQKN